MKKIVTCVFAVLFVCSAFSQEKKIAGGLYFGPGMSWLRSETKAVESDGVRLGYSFGALLDVNIMSNFAFSTGLTFNNYGGKLIYKYGIPEISPKEGDNRSVADNTKLVYHLNYLSIPLGFKGKTNEIGYMTYFLKAGLNPMINIKSKADIGEEKGEFINKEIKLFNLGWHIGGGLEFTLAGDTKLLVEILYTGGILDFDKTNIYTSESKDNTDNPRSLINEVGLKVGILF